MKIFARRKDGGPESTVTGYWLVEIRSLFSVALLRFGPGGRRAYHSHAFDSISWVLSGRLLEQHLRGSDEVHRRSWRPVITRRDTFHRVFSDGASWGLTLRGPWARTWHEYEPMTGAFTTLARGRVVVGDVSWRSRVR